MFKVEMSEFQGKFTDQFVFKNKCDLFFLYLYLIFISMFCISESWGGVCQAYQKILCRAPGMGEGWKFLLQE
mgnify:CR=1 FL=1